MFTVPEMKKVGFTYNGAKFAYFEICNKVPPKSLVIKSWVEPGSDWHERKAENNEDDEIV